MANPANQAPQSFMAAMIDFFGLLPNQGRMQMGKEIQALSEADRAYFRAGLVANGYSINA